MNTCNVHIRYDIQFSLFKTNLIQPQCFSFQSQNFQENNPALVVISKTAQHKLKKKKKYRRSVFSGQKVRTID